MSAPPMPPDFGMLLKIDNCVNLGVAAGVIDSFIGTEQKSWGGVKELYRSPGPNRR
jgi:hypothetical protein